MTTNAYRMPPRRSFRIIGIIIAVLLILGALGAGYWWSKRPAPYGIPIRVAWTTSHVQGTPDAPDPFIMQRAFPNLKFNKPLDIAFEPGGNRIVLVQHDNLIYSFVNDESTSKTDLMLDTSKLASLQGLSDYAGSETIGFAFDPDYQKNHYCYVCYHANFWYKPALQYESAYPQNATASHVSRFKVTPSDPPTIDPATEQIILRWPGNGHQGGCLKFGPDGNLYISTGDNGDPNPPDPHKVGQNIGDLRAKILRIDVRKPNGDTPYSIPADNPFVNTPGARGEVYAYGLRNPWRFSFDRVTGDCWAGDVGWELWESVQHIVPGGNYGWSITEGPQPVYPNEKQGPTPIIPSAIALPHTEAASLTGGYVYHGKRVPELQNQYLFGDWETRRLWAAPVQNDGKLGKYRTIAQTDLRIVSFGEDPDGEIYVLDYDEQTGGGIWRIAPNPDAGHESNFPRKLSETGLFADTAQQIPNPGVLSFTINTPQWVDGSTSERFIAVPGDEPVKEDNDGKPLFPKGTVLARTLSLPMTRGDASSRKNIETQLLNYDGRQWHAYAYQWDADKHDATLVDSAGRDIPLNIIDSEAPGGVRQQTWHVNSRAQCMTCHTTWTHYALAFNAPQIDRVEHYQTNGWRGVIADSQLRSFRHIGLMPQPKPPEKPKDGSPPPLPPPPIVMVDPYVDDNSHTLEQRARSYLAVNCSVCHRFGGGGTALIDLSPDKTLKETHLFTNPMLGGFDLPDAKVICPGNSGRSVLFYRMAKSGAGHMPHLGANVIDEKGLNLIAKWIDSLPATDPADPNYAKQEAAESGALLALQGRGTADDSDASIRLLLNTTDGALRLVAAMEDGSVPQKYRDAIVAKAMASSIGTVRDLYSRFVTSSGSAVVKVGTDPDADKLVAMTGNADRGRKIFFEVSGGLCSRCHIIDGQGTDFGPDLSHIGTKYNRADMLDNILHPSKTIVPGYETYVVRTKSGQSYIGFVTSRSDAQVVLKDQERKLITIATGDIDKMVAQPISAMPEGIISDLEPQQAADLLEFLMARK